jgi:hypothetical protein
VKAPERATAHDLTYVYAVVRSPRTPVIPRGLRGLPWTKPVRALAVGDALWLILADAPPARYSAGAIERGLQNLDWVSACAAGHEGVVERFATAEALAPMKLFTIFETDARALGSIRADLPRIRRALDRVAGRQEWGVRVVLDERRAVAHARQRRPKAPRSGRGAGATFLARKKAERDLARALVTAGRRAMGAVFDELAGHADEAHRRGPTQAEAATRLLLDAAFLVSARDGARFENAVKRITRSVGRRGYDVTLTGPWPPYTFAGDPS